MGTTETPSMLRRLVWFAILWAGGVASVAVIAMVLRWLIHP